MNDKSFKCYTLHYTSQIQLSKENLILTHGINSQLDYSIISNSLILLYDTSHPLILPPLSQETGMDGDTHTHTHSFPLSPSHWQLNQRGNPVLTISSILRDLGILVASTPIDGYFI